MTTEIRTICTVGSDGVVAIPVGVEDAGIEVEVTVKPRQPGKRASEMTQAEYAAFIDSIAGQWVGDFAEVPRWPVQERDPL